MPDNGKYLKLVTVKKEPHFCKPPDWVSRKRSNAQSGSIWQCECGTTWDLTDSGWMLRSLVGGTGYSRSLAEREGKT